MTTTDTRPFDAVLIVAFGGPQGPADVRPFLANVLRGRRIPPERVEEVAHHYELFGGVSPLTEITLRQADGLRERLRLSGLDLPVYVGMRNWRPLLADTLAEMSRVGVRRAIGLIAAAHHSSSSCEQYKQNVRDARAALRTAGLSDIEFTYVPSWYDRPGFIAAIADRGREAFARLPAFDHASARLVFTAHSIPVEMADRCCYVEQLMVTAGQVAQSLDVEDWTLVYQSRSGRPQDPWLGPDICEYLREEHAKGLRSAVIAPIGFLSDHIEVLYDLDHEAAAVCRELGITMARAGTVGDHPAFLDMMAEVVRETAERYHRFPPLPITP
jgi:protoporphyrin/coproporphyrin ferrochelatase